MVNILDLKPHPDGVAQHIKKRCNALRTTQACIKGIIFDNWQNDKGSRFIYSEVQKLLGKIPVVVLQSVDDVSEITEIGAADRLDELENLFLWGLTRSRIRELVAEYVCDIPNLEENAVTKRVLDQIDTLNLHRTPLNCLTLLKLLEQQFEESPVNRTEMIGKVLSLLFSEFQGVPRYTTRPDLKDCERALGFLCEWMIREEKGSFSKDEFIGKVREFCTAKIVDLDAEILFLFLIAENLFVRKGTDFEFRFRYWMYYFAAHRMHHDPAFANFILSNGRYAAFPEMIEFYTGIDRSREDAVKRIILDLRQANNAFSERTKIADDFEPWGDAQWVFDEQTVEKLLKSVTEGATDSALPVAVKDAIADKTYDPSRPYRQDLAKFLAESSLRQMVSTMRGAARALRNSDYVDPALKMELMEEVVRCWRRMCQILALLSPLLAEQRRAHFEGMSFILDDSFDPDKEIRFEEVLGSIPHNIEFWYGDDIFSKKLGMLFSRYIDNNKGTLGEALIFLVMVTQRSPGWEKELDAFIDRSKKNSYYLYQVVARLIVEYRMSVTNERTRQHLRRLAAKGIAKHRGSKSLSTKVIAKMEREIDEKD